LAQRLAPLGDIDTLVRDGALALHTLADLYDLDHVIIPEEQLAKYVAVNDQAVAEGYIGLRVLADVTALIADPARRAEHARFELLADCYMATRPFTVMCVYDRRVVGEVGVADIACVHPLARASDGVVPFALFGTDEGLALCGEVDCFSAPMLVRTLARTPKRDESLVIDLSAAGYLDHHAVSAFVDCSRELARTNRRLVVRNPSPGVRKICRALAFDTSNISFA
jgi:anti-anti-sigma regulatory factor